MKLLLPIILIAISIGNFLLFVHPHYQQIGDYKAKIAEYDDALSNEAKLEQDRDALSNTYHSFPLDAEMRLEKMLPTNADNIRLIIDIQKIAVANGMNVVSTQFDSTKTTGVVQVAGARGPQKDYGIFDLEFSVTGTYQNFVNFLKAMESSLRINDIQSINFSSDKKDNYSFDIKIKTYWLKAQ
ncbi:MAG: type 4a pilus biogenesis protein PilO [bacterium]